MMGSAADGTDRMDHDFFSGFVVLLLVLDPLGNLPGVLALLKAVPVNRRRRLIATECFIAFGVLLMFMLTGKAFLDLIHLSERSLEVAGGVILFMVAIRMVFPEPSGMFGDLGDRVPVIFPLAVPLIAGPSAMATVLLMTSQQPERLLEWIAALVCAMTVTTIVLLAAGRLLRLLGESVLSAFEKLMGLVLSAVAVEMTLAGIRRYFDM
jgi:MarC family membrane protein